MMRRTLWIATALLALLVIAGGITVLLWKPERPTPPPRVFEFIEKVFADLGPTPPEGAKRREIWRSPDGGKLAYKITRVGRAPLYQRHRKSAL